MNKKKILNNLFIVLLIIGFVFLSYVISFGEVGKERAKFCVYSHDNDSFMNSFTNNEPVELIVCSNSDNYNRCIHENSTYAQMRFVNECQFGQSMYLQLIFSVGFASLAIACIFMLFAKDKNAQHDKDEIDRPHLKKMKNGKYRRVSP